MAFLNSFKDLLFSDMINNFDVRMLIMWAIGGILIYLAIKKEMEPTVLLPMGFVDNLYYMGMGMLGIIIVMGVLIGITTLLNKIFSKTNKKDKEDK